MSEHRGLPPDYRHTRATECARLRTVTFCRRLMAQPCTPQCNPQAVQSFKIGTANAGVEGNAPRLSLGVPKGVFSSEREYPLCLVQRQQALPSPPLVRGNQKGIPSSEKEYPLCLAVAQSAALIRAAPTGAAFPFFEGTKKEPSNGRLSFLLD